MTPLGSYMTPLESLVNNATTWSVTLELSIVILESSFNDHNMFIVQATGQYGSINQAEKIKVFRHLLPVL
jgi:hypothetical protein